MGVQGIKGPRRESESPMNAKLSAKTVEQEIVEGLDLLLQAEMTAGQSKSLDAALDRRALVNETNNIAEFDYTSDNVDYSEGPVSLKDERLVSVDRIRLLTDPGFPRYDISYVWGTLKDGRHVRIADWELGTIVKGRPIGSQLFAACKKLGVYGKGLGMFRPSVVSVMR